MCLASGESRGPDEEDSREESQEVPSEGEV